MLIGQARRGTVWSFVDAFPVLFVFLFFGVPDNDRATEQALDCLGGCIFGRWSTGKDRSRGRDCFWSEGRATTVWTVGRKRKCCLVEAFSGKRVGAVGQGDGQQQSG